MAFSFGRLLLLVNSVLILAALGISLIFAFSWLSPKSFDNFGKRHLETYLNTGRMDAAQAIADLQEGNTDTAQDLLEEWDHYQSGDRYFAFKRNVAIALSNTYYQAGSYQEAADVIAPLMAEDDRDIVAFMAWAKAALKIDSTREAAAAQVTEFWTRFPKSEAMTELYLREVYAWDDPVHAKNLLEEHGYLKPLDPTGWEVFWGSKQKINARDRRSIDFETTGSDWIAKIDVPKGTQLLRIDPPVAQKLVIDDFQVHLLGDMSTVIGEEGHGLKMITLEDGIFRTNGGPDPFIAVDVQELVENTDAQDIITLVVKLNVKSEFTGWIAKRMEGL
ncbi:hypothetical protein [uncultured Roseovarius sp.]|uniref:hypothetical protein n=1 Tax=uncultured Roseovarius sp. TaxID=293344 RepID=UPI00261A5794|nr:hypothetical protein [uncultured Roseovarius sp.]